MKLLLATRNAHKVSELADLLKECGLEVVSLDQVPGVPEVSEDQETLEGNAAKKARACADASGLWALADDTGLEVSALGGRPGVYSARYAGPGCSYDDNNRKLLAELAGLGDRGARFRTVIALAEPKGRVLTESGALEGSILREPRGANGFGYDPVFLVSEAGKSLAELSASEKNALSHRARALRAMLPHLRKLAAGLLLLLVLAAPSLAGRTEPGQETIWDQIMATQANRGLRQGSKHLDAKQYDLALKEFRKAVQASPKDAVAHMMLGVALYWSGDVDGSLASYEKSLELEPQNAQAHMLIGISRAWKGEIEPAYQAFKRAAELEPARADIQMNLGSIEETRGMVPEALAHFRKAASLDPKNPLYHFQLGMLYRKLGRDEEAVDAMRQALKHFPDFEDALLELGAAEERQGDQKAAMSSFKRAVDLKNRDAVARFRLARLQLAAKDQRRARETMAEAFHLTPEEGGGGLQLSVAFGGGKSGAPGARGDKPSAKPGEEAPSKDPLDVFRKNLERVPLEQGAVMQVDMAFVPKPKLIKATESSLKRALEKQLKDRPAAKAVRRQYTLRPAKPGERAEQIAGVLDDLRGLMKEAPADADTRLGMNLTFTHLEAAGRGPSGEPPKAVFQPRNVGNDLGLWVMGTGWMALVEEVLPEGHDAPAKADDADSWVVTGLGYATMGDGQRALTAFERAVALDAANELALLGRGVASVMLGDEDTAVASYREVLKLNPKNKPAKEGLTWLLRPAASKAQAKAQP